MFIWKPLFTDPWAAFRGGERHVVSPSVAQARSSSLRDTSEDLRTSSFRSISQIETSGSQTNDNDNLSILPDRNQDYCHFADGPYFGTCIWISLLLPAAGLHHDAAGGQGAHAGAGNTIHVHIYIYICYIHVIYVYIHTYISISLSLYIYIYIGNYMSYVMSYPDWEAADLHDAYYHNLCVCTSHDATSTLSSHSFELHTNTRTGCIFIRVGGQARIILKFDSTLLSLFGLWTLIIRTPSDREVAWQ